MGAGQGSVVKRNLVWPMLAVLALARLAAMALVPLLDTTEARYAEIARKMVELKDWVTPWHDYGVPFWGKPPLSYWLTAASLKTFGINEFAARLPHFVVLALIAALVWQLARRRAGSEATIAVTLLASSALFFVSAGAVMTDGPLVLGATMSLYGFWLAMAAPPAGRPSRSGWWFFAGIAVGLLAKGPLVLVLVGLPLMAWLTISRRWSQLWQRLPWIGGSIMVLVIALPWYVLAELRTPGFLEYFLVGEHWHRFVTPGWTGDRYGGAHAHRMGTIWVYALAALLPWSVLLPIAAWRWRKDPVGETAPGEREWVRYLLCWALTPMVFFTVAGNIIWTYVLPAMPAAALLTATWLARRPRGQLVDRWLGAGLALAVAAVAAGWIYLALANDWSSRATAKPMVQAYESQRASGQPLLFLGGWLFSAAFYTDGAARRLADSAAVWQRLGSGGGFVAVDVSSGAALVRQDGRVVTRVGHFNAYDLLFVAPREQAADTASQGAEAVR